LVAAPYKKIALTPFDFKNKSHVWSKREFSGFVSHKRFLKSSVKQFWQEPPFFPAPLFTEKVAQMIQSGICFNGPGPVLQKMNVNSESFQSI